MADLSQLFKHAPVTAGWMLGGQVADQSAKAKLDREQMGLQNLTSQQTYDFNQQNNPLKLENNRLGNQTLEAQLPGVRANSDSLGYKARLEAGTLESSIGAGNAKNAGVVQGEAGKTEAARLKVFDDALPMLESVQDSRMRMQILAEAAKRNGFDPDDPGFQKIAAGIAANPQGYAKIRAELARRQAVQSPDYVKEQLQEDGRNRRHGQTLAQNQKLEEMRIEAGKYTKAGAAANFHKILMSKMNAEQKVEALDSLAIVAEMANDNDTATKLRAYMASAEFRAIRAAEARKIDPTKLDMGAVTGLPINGRQAVPPPQPGNAPTPPPVPRVPSLVELQKAYPGKSAEELKARFKKTHGVDIQ